MNNKILNFSKQTKSYIYDSILVYTVTCEHEILPEDSFTFLVPSKRSKVRHECKLQKSVDCGESKDLPSTVKVEN